MIPVIMVASGILASVRYQKVNSQALDGITLSQNNSIIPTVTAENTSNLYGLLSIQELDGGGLKVRKAGAYGNRE